MSRARITGIVLAGGRSARFGSDKLAAELGGTTLLARSIDRVAPIVDELLVAGPFPAGPSRAAPTPTGPAPAADPSLQDAIERHSGTKLRRIDDAEPFAGPLAALAGALASARGSQAIVVAGDMPDLVTAVLRSMLDRLEADPSVDALTLGSTSPKRQALPLALRVEAARLAAAAAIDGGDRSLVRLLDRLAVAEIPLDAWQPLDPDAKTLRDVDTPADLERLHDPRLR